MLDELRKKPKAVKEKYAFWGAFSITAIIASVWMISLSVKLDLLNDPTENETSVTQNDGAFSRSFSDIKNNLANVWSTIVGHTSDEMAEVEMPSSTDTATATESEIASSTVPAPATSSPSATNPLRRVLIATSSIPAASSTE